MKKKNVFVLLLILFTGLTVCSQTYIFSVQQKGSKKYGYASIDGKVIIKPKFSAASEFSNQGVAMVYYKRKFHIINKQGEIIETAVKKIQPFGIPGFLTSNNTLWNNIQTYSDGYLVVAKNNKWGCLGPDGNIVVPIKYNILTDFDNGYALAKLNNAFFVIDKNGTEIPMNVNGLKEIKHFSEGLAPIEVDGEKWGFVDINGKIAIEPEFTNVGYFNDGLAWARNEAGEIGFINKSGEWVIKPQFASVQPFDPESKLAMVKIDDSWGYVDTKGGIHFFEETTTTFSFSEGLAIGRKNEKVGFFNNAGHWVIPPTFDAATGFKNGYAAVKSNNLWGIIDKEGNWILQPTFSQIGDVAIIE